MKFLIKLKLIRVIGIGLILLITGCNNDGDPGPQGDQGIQGEQGEKGEKGDAGSMDITYSDWLQLDWNLNDSPTIKAHSLEATELTRDFIDQGGVLLMFLKDGDFIYSIPFSGGNDFVYYIISLPNELLIYIGTSGASVEESFTNGEYRYILIPGENDINGRTTLPDPTNYDEVVEYYSIPN